ncbi:MAG TPA: hypothetical protein VM867_03065, partial [Xanthobacteraceae bacterium]|nr:hypothetical protein [Xanthobacteraceae bacterium]
MDKLSPTLEMDFRTVSPEREGNRIAAGSNSDSASKPAGPPPSALILGGAHGSLAIARSLGRRGIDVSFATHDHPLAKYSRYVKRGFSWPGPNDPNAINWLLAFAACWGGLEGCVLFPGGDAELRLLSQYYDVLAKAFHVAVPAWSITQFAHDKRLTQQHAQTVGVATPLSLYPKNADDVAKWTGPFPVIIKPTVHDVQNALTRAKAWRADNLAMLVARYKEAAALMAPDSIVI